MSYIRYINGIPVECQDFNDKYGSFLPGSLSSLMEAEFLSQAIKHTCSKCGKKIPKDEPIYVHSTGGLCGICEAEKCKE